MKTLIQLNQVEKQFGGQQVIHPMALSVFEGEFLTLLGPSGCGKTTLLRMIAGFEQPSKGDIFLLGENITHLPPYKRDMNMVFQHYALFPHMTVEENILFGLKMKGVNQSEQKRRLEEVLELTQLSELRQRRPAQLSGGQQQRVAIARAVVNQPKVLLLDEPLGALDYQLRKSLQIELKNLQKQLGITFVYVTHDQEEAMTMSDRIVILNKGKIEQIGTPQEIYYRPRNVFVANFIGENNIIEKNGKQCSIRPEKIKVYRAGEQINEKTRTGKITDVIFSGNHIKLYISLEHEAQRLLAYDYTFDAKLWKQGEIVNVEWNESDEVELG
jgi:spermidine/putrescine transport system ATP-binding protein